MRSYLKFLSRNKLYTAIQAVGLVVSLAFVLLTGHFVWQQKQMTRNVPQYEDVYSVYKSSDGYKGLGQSWGFAYQAKESVPEVEKAAMFWKSLSEEATVDMDGTKYHVKTYMVGGDFFDIFPAEFENGNAEVMSDISNAIISRSFANRLGGNDDDILGKSIDGEFTIAAIIKETPNPIFGDVDIIINIENLTNRKNAPFRMDVIPFLKVRRGTDRVALEEKADTLVAREYDAIGARDFLDDSGLVRYDEVWYSPANNMELKKGNRLFTGIILLITIILLLSAIFNYINLSVALSGKRAKEMATRKVLGAGKYTLAGKWLLECILFTSVCFILAVLLAEWLTPWFNRIIDSDIYVRVRYTPGWVAVYVVFILLVSMVQGAIPAWISSRYPAISIVKGEFRTKKKHLFSKVFIVLQHAFSIILLSLAIILGLQVSHMLNRPLGAAVENAFYAQLNDSELQEVFALKAASLPCVSRIGHSTYFPGMAEEWISEDKDKGRIRLAVVSCDSTAFDIFGFQVQEQFEEPTDGTVWISERQMSLLGVDRNTEDLGYHHVMGQSIGGIIGDFAPNDVLNYDSDIMSYVMIGPAEEQYGLLIETVGDHAQAKKSLSELYTELCMLVYGIEDKPYMFNYINDILSDNLSEEKNHLSLVSVFMLLSFLLSALGLIAMSSYFADESSKDIAIRKVFGSTISDEVKKTVLEYLVLFALAAVIAIPVAIRLASRLLEPYSYRISGYGWAFLAAIAIAAVVTLVSVLWQTMKAAKTNPATELKKE